MKIIDSHQHFWKYRKESHSWITDEMAAIRKDFQPEDLQPVYEEHGILGCVAVQADQTLEETHTLLELAEKFSFIQGVVGWVDLSNAYLETEIETLWAGKNKLKGFRHVLQGEEPEFMLQSSFIEGIRTIGRMGYTYDILIYPHLLPAAIELVSKLPDVNFILDHIAKPVITKSLIDEWAGGIHALADFENVSCKISGMVTEADYVHWRYEDFVPYLDVVARAFGSGRLMFGSDWPVCLVAGAYGEVLNIPMRYFENWSVSEKEDIFYNNAMRTYKLS